MIEVKNLKVVNICWSCGKAHDDVPYNFTARDKTVKCDCGGNVVSRTGKVQMTLVSAIPVFIIDDGETHRWAADSAERAKAAHIEMYGELDETAKITQITDPIEFNRRFILPDEQSRMMKSINDVVSEIDEFPALISSSVW